MYTYTDTGQHNLTHVHTCTILYTHNHPHVCTHTYTFRTHGSTQSHGLPYAHAHTCTTPAVTVTHTCTRTRPYLDTCPHHHPCPFLIPMCQHDHACAHVPTSPVFSRVWARLPVRTHTSAGACFVHTPTRAHFRRWRSHTHAHARPTPPHPHTRSTRAAPHQARAYATHARAHTLTANFSPPGADTPHHRCHAHTCSPRKASVGRKCGAPGCRTDGLSHLSCLPALACVCAAVSSPPPPSVGRGQEEHHRGQGRPLPALKNFTPPTGPGPSAKPPHPAGWKPKAGLVRRLLGMQGPRSHQSPGPHTCPLPEPCFPQRRAPPRASRRQMGLRQPSSAPCPVPGLRSSGWGRGPPTHWPPAGWGSR